jgi:hypothetical protein
MIMPLSMNDLRKLLFPFYEYRFHLVGLLVGVITSISIFFKSLKTTQDKAQWIDILFLAITASFVPLGFFLLLGDDYIGKTNEGLLSITALHPESKVAKFASVYPVGIMISIASTLLHAIGLIIIKLSKKP